MQKRGANLRSNLIVAFTLLWGLAACAVSPAPSAPQAPAAPAPAPVVQAAVPTPSRETPRSAQARAYYAQVQQSLLSQGMLRTDGGGVDTPYSDFMLTEDFLRVALYDEYGRSGGGNLVKMQTQSELRRWVSAVRVGIRFGASVSADRKATDTARVSSYLARLSQVTGHPIRLDNASPNFLIYIVSEDERMGLGPELQAALPEMNPNDLSAVLNLPRSTYCVVYAQSNGRGVYNRAFAVVRSEHPDLLALSCLHEEIAQGLGLPNDSREARPSIFNDDEEFALLTRMDEQMLRILYSPELRPGMTEAEARPIVEQLASRLVGSQI